MKNLASDLGFLGILSACYLAWMATKLVRAGSKVGFIAFTIAPCMLDGILLPLVNRKAYVVATTFFGGFVFLPDSYWLEVALKFLLLNIVWIPVHILWLWFGVSLKPRDLQPRVQFGSTSRWTLL